MLFLNFKWGFTTTRTVVEIVGNCVQKNKNIDMQNGIHIQNTVTATLVYCYLLTSYINLSSNIQKIVTASYIQSNTKFTNLFSYRIIWQMTTSWIVSCKIHVEAVGKIAFNLIHQNDCS